MFVGQPDVDCLNDALCCFDGCANVCQGAGPIQQPAQPPTPVRPAQGIDRWIVFQVALPIKEYVYIRLAPGKDR